MGADKATLRRPDGATWAEAVAAALAACTGPTVEVGPGRSGLPAVADTRPGEGPLSALADAAAALARRGHTGPAVLLACDMPFVDADLVRWLADHPAPGSVVPVVAGRSQPLCARWSAEALASCAALVASGHRSLRPLVDRPDTVLAGPEDWSASVAADHFRDFDTPEELSAAGLALVTS